MKKVLALMIALMMLLLCACGQEAASAQDVQGGSTVGTEAQSAEKQQDPIAETNAEGYYVQEKKLEDGTVVTVYLDGGPKGAIVKAFAAYTDGSKSEEGYDSEGKLEYMIWNDADGSVYEMYYYPSGNMEKNISKMADGFYYETHYMDNGSFDEKTGIGHDGTITYQKTVTPDGQVEEITYDVEEDGTRWDTDEWEDGTIVKTHYGTNGYPIEQTMNNEQTGDHTETTYYENGSEKTRDSYHAGQKLRVYLEYYEDNSVKYSLMEGDNGSKSEEKINEAGYTTYYFENFNNTKDCEFFANDTGELVKYVENGTVYEGDAIPSSAKELFNQVRKVPAQDMVTTQGADGSSSTTTTYADGTVSQNGTKADGTIFYENISANGDRTYEEYYANGKLKLLISETADAYQEVHGDEDGYYTYYLQKVPGWEMEITCDETGKVDKVLLNGQEQTDVEQYVKDMFFRSW